MATVDGEARHLACELARADFERDLEPFLDRSLRAVTTALQDAPACGRASSTACCWWAVPPAIPRIAAVLTERLGQEPHGEVDPDLCVALGAGVQAGIEMGQDTQAVLVDITPYTFGTRAEGELYGRPYANQFIPLIRRNSKLPATRTEVFFTLFEDQEAVEIKVFQGEDPDAVKNVEIGTFMFTGLNEREDAHEQGLLVTYRLDLDGLLHLHARERGDRPGTARRRRERHRALHRRGARRVAGTGLRPLGRGGRRGGDGRTGCRGTLRSEEARNRLRRRLPCPRMRPGKSRRPWRGPSRPSMRRRPRTGKR